MNQNQSKIWQTSSSQQLLAAISALAATTNDLPNFLRDVLTEKEILEISARFRAAQLLTQGVSYELITKQTNLSTRTIARISQWLKEGTGGYQAAITSLTATQPDGAPQTGAHHSHIPPARAE